MSDRLNGLLTSWLQGDEALKPMVENPSALEWVSDADHIEIAGILRFFESVPPTISPTQRQLLDRALNLLAIHFRDVDELPVEELSRIENAYRRWGNQHRLGHLLLSLLSALGTRQSLEIFSTLVVEDPPENSSAAAMAFVPLLRQESLAVDTLFPKLLEALSHLPVASLILDLANYVTLNGMTETHPAADRVAALGELFAGLITRLRKYESEPTTDQQKFASARQQVAEATSISIAICDALAQIGDAKAISKLKPALELRHRKIRAEAAVALAKLGDDEGKEMLCELAAQAVCRSRVLAVADDLGLMEKVPKVYRSDEARAEGDLSAWLSMDSQFGLPPQYVEVVDRSSLKWPGYDEAVDCFLIRYAYEMPKGTFQSVGIVGPVTQSFAVDLTELSAKDIYSAYAGWQAEHPDVFDVDPENWQPNQKELVENFQQRLISEGYQDVRPAMLSFFFGDARLIAVARNSKEIVGSVVVDL